MVDMWDSDFRGFKLCWTSQHRAARSVGSSEHSKSTRIVKDFGDVSIIKGVATVQYLMYTTCTLPKGRLGYQSGGSALAESSPSIQFSRHAGKSLAVNYDNQGILLYSLPTLYNIPRIVVKSGQDVKLQ